MRVSVDIGGTFTDCVVEDGPWRRVHKAPTTPTDPPAGVLDVLTKAAAPGSLGDLLAGVDTLLHGTTLATNVLLTRRGARTGFITTGGFRDVIEIRRGIRNLGTSMFDQFRPPYRALVPRSRRQGVPERTLYTGEVETPLDEEATEAAVRRLLDDGCESIAIGFLHSYANPENELVARAVVQRLSPHVYVACSHEIQPTRGEFERFSSTVVSAYVGPSVSDYLDDLERRLVAEGLRGSLLIVLSSALVQTVSECRARAVELLVSGPAAAPAAALDATGDLDTRDVLEVDMGGTSFDLCVIRDRRIPTTQEAWVGEERVATKMVDVATIGAGGGSVAWIDSLGLLRVGPQSAGADPGPAAYGRSDLPTVTDADLVLGYLSADNFLGGQIQLDVERARRAVDSLAQPLRLDTLGVARAIFETVNGVMADAVTEVCTKKGLDVRGFVLVAGGGAGGIHGAAIAEFVGIPAVLYPATGPVLSAMGMLTMELGRELTRAGVWDRTAVTATDLNEMFDALTREQEQALIRSGVSLPSVAHRRSLAMRYLGQFHEIFVDLPDHALTDHDRAVLASDFHREYASLYGYSLPSRPVEILECHLRSSVPRDGAAPTDSPEASEGAAAAVGQRDCWLAGVPATVAVYQRDLLASGHTLAGPALVDSDTSTVLVPAGFTAHVDTRLNLVLTRRDPSQAPGPAMTVEGRAR